ncbi:MAG TPA: M67 family metallopeptidase [Chloroflexota bacterium]|nr:M67 family metallopeptidase [Chloroflexota bacterium]
MLELPRQYADQMIAQARAEMPAEACGLIAGSEGTPVKLFPIPNADPSIYRYNMEPRAQLAAMREMDDQGWDLLAIYHSHTHTAAFPSPTDVKLAFYPESLYVIVSLQQEEPAIRAYRIVEGEISEVEVRIV